MFVFDSQDIASVFEFLCMAVCDGGVWILLCSKPGQPEVIVTTDTMENDSLSVPWDAPLVSLRQNTLSPEMYVNPLLDTSLSIFFLVLSPHLSDSCAILALRECVCKGWVGVRGMVVCPKP